MSQSSPQQVYIKAVNFAARKHATQRRKDAEKTPYINHPIEVSYLLSQAGVTDNAVLVAGLLHDTVEDTETTYVELVQEFGAQVADIVRECTDNKSLDKVTRKKAQVDHAATISNPAKLVKLADKLSNNRGLVGNPPASWSPEEIYGCALWSYCVCDQMRGINESLDQQLAEVFRKWKFAELSPEAITAGLATYYKTIDQSE